MMSSRSARTRSTRTPVSSYTPNPSIPSPDHTGAPPRARPGVIVSGPAGAATQVAEEPVARVHSTPHFDRLVVILGRRHAHLGLRGSLACGGEAQAPQLRRGRAAFACDRVRMEVRVRQAG